MLDDAFPLLNPVGVKAGRAPARRLGVHAAACLLAGGTAGLPLSALAQESSGPRAAPAEAAASTPVPESASPTPAAADTSGLPASPAAPASAPDTLRYTLGLRVKFADFGDLNGDTIKLRPIIGLRWGRWRVGIGDGTEWLRFSGFRKEPGLSYDWFDSRRVKFGLSLRVQNVDTGQDWDPFEKGRHTLRGRALWNIDVGQDWSLGIDLGHDLLKRGDGSTVGLGFSRSFPLSEIHMLQASGGWTWGTGTHWRTAYRNNPLLDTSGIDTGWGSFGAGLAYRHRLSHEWSAFASAGPSRALGHVGTVVGDQWVWSGQVGVLRFFR